MPTIGKAGFAFSLDLIIAFLAMLLMLSLMLASLEMQKETETKAIQGLELQRKAVFLTDSLVKNRNEKEPLLGSALYNAEKKRVMANRIDLEMLSKAGNVQSKEFFVSSLVLKTKNSEETSIGLQAGKNCVSLDRIVLAGNEMAKVKVVVCEKKRVLP